MPVFRLGRFKKHPTGEISKWRNRSKRFGFDLPVVCSFPVRVGGSDLNASFFPVDLEIFPCRDRIGVGFGNPEVDFAQELFREFLLPADGRNPSVPFDPQRQDHADSAPAAHSQAREFASGEVERHGIRLF